MNYKPDVVNHAEPKPCLAQACYNLTMAEANRYVGLEAAQLLLGATSDSDELRALTEKHVEAYRKGAESGNNADRAVLALFENRLSQFVDATQDSFS